MRYMREPFRAATENVGEGAGDLSAVRRHREALDQRRRRRNYEGQLECVELYATAVRHGRRSLLRWGMHGRRSGLRAVTWLRPPAINNSFDSSARVFTLFRPDPYQDHAPLWAPKVTPF